MNGMRVFSVACTAFAGLILVPPASAAGAACRVGQGDQGDAWRSACRAAMAAERNPSTKGDMYFALSYDAVEREAFDEALAILDEGVRANPGHYSLHSERAFVLGEFGRYREALTELDTAIKIDPERSNAFSERAWARFMSADFAGSLADRDAGMRFSPRDPAAREARAGVLLWMGRFDEALADARNGLDLARKGGMSDVVTRLGSFPEAVRSWQSRVSTAPPAVACRAARTAGKYDAAGLFGDCSMAFLASKTGPDRAEMLSIRARAREFLAEGENADPVDLQMAVALDPANSQWHLDLANRNLNVQHSWAARNEFSQILASNPRNGAALAGRALAYFNLNLPDKARADALASLAIAANARANIVLGDLAMQQGDKAAARTHWLAAWKLEPGNAALRTKLRGIGVSNPDAPSGK